MVLRDFQENKKTKRVIYSWPAIVIVALLCLAVTVGIFRVLRTSLALNREIKDLEGKIAEAGASQKNYERKLAELESPAGLDREARGRFNLKKPGEEVVIFVEEPLSASAGSVASRLRSFFKKLWPF